MNRKYYIKEKDVRELAKIADIARLYYEKGLSQEEIKKKGKISQSEVSRLLKLAKERQMVKISILPKFEPDLAEKLKEKFVHLEEVIVSYTDTDTDIDLLEILGYEGAKHLINNIEHADKFGISCGLTLAALIKNLENARKNLSRNTVEKCSIYALVNPCIDEIVNPTPASMVAFAVRQMPNSIGYAYQFPEPDGKIFKSLDNFKKLKRIKDMIEEMKNLDFYYVGIGNLDFSFDRKMAAGTGLQFNHLVSHLKLSDTLKKLNAVGECDFQPFNEDGEFLIDRPELKPLRNHIIYLPLKILQNQVKNKSTKKIIAIAGGEKKEKAISAALKAKFFNCLITDSSIAVKLLNC